MSSKAIEVLNEQLQLDCDGIKAYGDAIDACENDDIRDHLWVIQQDHECHVTELSECLRAYGGKRTEGADFKRFFVQAFTESASGGDRTVLLAMRDYEELTNRSYESALKSDLPEDVRKLLERNLKGERRHIAWIKEALQTRAWEEPEFRRETPLPPGHMSR